MKKKLAALSIFSALVLAACTEEEGKSVKDIEQDKQQVEQAAEKTEKTTRVAMDHLDREVEIEGEIARVISGTLTPYYSLWYVATDSTKELVGMNPTSYSTAKNSILATMSPEVLNASTSFIENGEVNVEEVLKLNPDIQFEPSGSQDLISKLESVGVTVAGLNTINANSADPLSTYDSWLTFTSQLTNTTDRAEHFLKEARSVQDDIAESLKDVKEEQQPRVMFIFQHDENAITITGNNHFGQQWLNSTGGINVAKEEITGSKQVNMEQIFEWNPDIIYITNFTETQPVDLFENKFAGQDWSQVKAVQEGKVYKVPVGVFRWYPPSGDAPLMLKWMAQKNHPELFKYSMEEEVKKYYKDFYHFDLTDEQIWDILNPSSKVTNG
ncbi:ABC transporter substrate-binding protein [Metasolibacillus meyeri]|uniref:ABC transporter substrate-binding protein n=1 Tax=Metasolibacillus meyeri TaxID=1071052 RepID=UPI000D309B00|nr:ABC transporter substrate-binding protein [Metasolibacillus meyeri]